MLNPPQKESEEIENTAYKMQNNIMKRTILAIFIFLAMSINLPILGEELDEDMQENSTQKETQELTFEPIDLDIKSIQEEKKNKKFKLQIESEEKPVYIQNVRRLWDDSKLYRYQYYSDPKNLQPLIAPASWGSYLTRALDENTQIYVGQSGLSYYDGVSMNFIGKNEANFDNGAKMEHKGKFVDYSLGAYTDTKTLNNSYGGIISTKPQKIWNQSDAEISFGSGVYSNDYGTYSRNTAGFFTKYRKGKFTVSGQLSQNSYTSGTPTTNSSMDILSQYQINEYLLVRSKIERDFNTNYAADELTLRIMPTKNSDDFNFEITTSNVSNLGADNRKQLKFVTNFRF